MRSIRVLLGGLMFLVFTAGSVAAIEVSVKLSGPGAVDESTIRVGKPVSIDIYLKNDTIYTGFTMGFRVISPDIKKVTHVQDTDSSKGLVNDGGDIKGHNGWQDQSVWDLKGLFVSEIDWDGTLPDTIGFGGLSVKEKYDKHELEKKISFDLIVPAAGTLVIDSSFFPPGGKWLFSAPQRISITSIPKWSGPYKFKVIK